MEFPLSDDLFQSMLQMMPQSHQSIIDECLQQDAELLLDQDEQASIINNNLDDATVGQILKSEYSFQAFNKTDGFSVSGGGITGGGSSMLLEDSDEETESIESGLIDEDPNDPEWFEPPGRL